MAPDTQPGFLRRARLRKSTTRRTYAESWKAFLEFCLSHNLLASITSPFVTMMQLDCALERFAENLFLEGSSKYVFTCALQNCNIEYPHWPTASRLNYPLTKAAKKGWANMEPGSSRDPCPIEVAAWIAYDMSLRGLVYHAAAVMLSFDTYIRPGKMCELKHSNIIAPSKGMHKRYHHWTLLLHPQEAGQPSKAGAFNDSLIVGLHDRKWVGTLLGKLFSKHAGQTDGALFPFSLRDFELEFSKSVTALKLSKLQLTPHCLRHGGASHDYLANSFSLADIQQRGCWKTIESVRRYSKHGRLSKQLSLLTPAQQRHAKQALHELPDFLLKRFWIFLLGRLSNFGTSNFGLWGFTAVRTLMFQLQTQLMCLVGCWLSRGHRLLSAAHS